MRLHLAQKIVSKPFPLPICYAFMVREDSILGQENQIFKLSYFFFKIPLFHLCLCVMSKSDAKQLPNPL